MRVNNQAHARSTAQHARHWQLQTEMDGGVNVRWSIRAIGRAVASLSSVAVQLLDDIVWLSSTGRTAPTHIHTERRKICAHAKVACCCHMCVRVLYMWRSWARVPARSKAYVHVYKTQHSHSIVVWFSTENSAGWVCTCGGVLETHIQRTSHFDVIWFNVMMLHTRSHMHLVQQVSGWREVQFDCYSNHTFSFRICGQVQYTFSLAMRKTAENLYTTIERPSDHLVPICRRFILRKMCSLVIICYLHHHLRRSCPPQWLPVRSACRASSYDWRVERPAGVPDRLHPPSARPATAKCTSSAFASDPMRLEQTASIGGRTLSVRFVWFVNIPWHRENTCTMYDTDKTTKNSSSSACFLV